MTLPERLDELERIARAATQGRWRHFKGDRINSIMCERSDNEIVHWVGFDSSHIKNKAQRTRNAAFIATCNPRAILELIAEVRALIGEKT